MPTIHFDTAKAITGLSRSSLWRRIREHPGSSKTVGPTKSQMRTRIDVDSALAWNRLGTPALNMVWACGCLNSATHKTPLPGWRRPPSKVMLRPRSDWPSVWCIAEAANKTKPNPKRMGIK
ncbi:hypothetical protein Thi970DRAFT_00876 [Thiorhodovibrio frisius]|uniref:Uncharacterized protein n=1 Tax=Thiorhodovibrio frisius TaxID=631362 RepID=H8YXP4_9GAMM|nr:hypothetical protein Thi970DRAFT_00876 [Thiorhodovibrio frisius]WPL23703.1 hypothetical protein Thiofri_03906 [Thiorhodovibrio frisius]